MASKFGGIPVKEKASRFGGVPIGTPENVVLRGENVGKTETQLGVEEAVDIMMGKYPEQGGIENLYQSVGQISRGVASDVFGAAAEGVKAVSPEWLKQGVVEAGAAAAQTPIGQAAIEGLQAGAQKYGEFAQEYPRMARNIEAFIGVAEAAPFGYGAAQAGKGVLKVKSRYLPKEIPITLDTVRDARRKAYKVAREEAINSGTTLKADKVRKNIDFKLRKLSKDPQYGELDIDIHPQTIAMKNKLKEVLSGNVSAEKIEPLRKKFNTFIKKSKIDMNETEDTIYLYALKDKFDEALDEMKPKDFVKGGEKFLSDFKEGRRISKIEQKMKPIDKIFRDAELPARNSSYEVALKNGFRSLAKNDRMMKRYTPEEANAIRRAATTGNIEAIMNKFGVFSPTSGKLGAAMFGAGGMGTAGGVVNPAFMALPAVGMASKAAADKIARTQAQKALEVVGGKFTTTPPRGFRLLMQDLERMKGNK